MSINLAQINFEDLLRKLKMSLKQDSDMCESRLKTFVFDYLYPSERKSRQKNTERKLVIDTVEALYILYPRIKRIVSKIRGKTYESSRGNY